MNKQAPPGTGRFSEALRLFEDLNGAAVAELLAAAVEIALILDEDGTILDVSYLDPALVAYGFDKMRGRKWHDTVTLECREKVDALLDQSKRKHITAKRQINHPSEGMPDLPVVYKLMSLDGFAGKIAVGSDMRQLSKMQQQLVQVQFDLESEYRRIQEAETRYRTAFQKMRLPAIMVDGRRKAILDVNMAASQLLARPAQKLIGTSLATLFERDHRDKLLNAITEVTHSGTLRTVEVQLAENSIDTNCAIEPYRENGSTNLIITITETGSQTETDFPELKHAAGSVKGIPEPYVVIDDKGVIRSINGQFLDLVGMVNSNQVIGRNLNNWLGTSPADTQVLISRVSEDGLVRQFYSFINDDLASRKPVTVSARHFESGGQSWVGVLFAEAGQKETQAVRPGLGLPGKPADFSDLVGRVPMKELIREALDVIEKMCIEAALQQTNNNRAAAAEILGLSRQSLYIKLRRHGLEDFDATKS